MRKFILTFMIMFMTVTVNAISAESSILIDADSGRVLMENNAYEKRGMASTTKIMTAIVALENANLSDIVTVSKNAVNVEGSSMWLKEGEKLPLESLLYGLMLNSGNDAATAIAEHIGGGIDGFADMMNKQAKKIGVKDTHFTNPHGLDNESHYTTAYDLAQITRYALNNETFSKIVATKSKLVESTEGGYNRNLNNHNKMLTLYDNADGVKTGFTKKCGRCLVSSATRDGMRLIAVTLNAPDDWNDHKEMLNFGFNKFHKETMLSKGDYIKSVMLVGGTENRVPLIVSEDLSTLIQDNEKCSLKYDIPDALKAPVVKANSYGKAMLYVNDKLIKTADVVAKYGVAEKKSFRFGDVLNLVVRELLSCFGSHA